MALSVAMQKMIKAHANIANRHMLFKGSLDSLQLEATNDFPTMATDGWKTFFNEEFTIKLDDKPHGELEAVCLHEHLHRMFNHPLRGYKIHQLEGEEYSHLCMNLAADFAINPIIADLGYKLPDGCCIDDKYRGMTMEVIYRDLKKQAKKDAKGLEKMLSGGIGGDVMSPVTAREAAALEEAAKRMKHKLEASKEQASKDTATGGSQAGYSPESLDRAFDEIVPSERADWREILRDPIQTHKSYREVSWSRPNRRSIALGIPMPGYEPDQITRIVLCVDTSGSMCDKIGEMKGEIIRLMDQALVNEVIIYAVDDKVRNKGIAKNADEVMDFEMRGGNGTHFRECMIEVGKENAVACVFLTDLQTGDFGPEPPFPTIWVDWTASNLTAPFGTTLRY